MATVETKLYTAEEFWDWWGEHGKEDTLYELDRGVIVEMPPPGELHGFICSLVAYFLTQYVVGRKQGYVCSNDTGLLLARNPDTVRGPDVMLFAESRKTSELSRKFSQNLPSLVVEVLSPEDRPGKTNRRIGQYLQRGIPLVWLIDPEEQTITVYRPNEHHRVLDDAEEINGDNALPDLRLRVADFFHMPGT